MITPRLLLPLLFPAARAPDRRHAVLALLAPLLDVLAGIHPDKAPGYSSSSTCHWICCMSVLGGGGQ